MVPNGWFTRKLDEIVKKTQLGSTERHKGDSCQSPIPLLKMGNLNWGGFNLTSLELLPLSKVEKTLLLNKGDFLFNTRNTPQLVGKSAVWNGELEKATFDNNINKITFHDDRADSFYMGYYLNTGIGKSKIRSLSAGSTSVAAIYWKDLKNIRIELPPIEEQRKITKILSTWDKAISTTERLIDNSKQQKKALMQQLLTGKKRLLDDSGKPFEGEWEEVKFGDCINHFGGTALEKHVSEDATHHFISIGNYSMDGKYVDKGQRVALNEKTSAKLLKKGELVMVLNDKTKTGDIIGSTILIDEDNKYIYNQRSERVIPKEDIHITFFWFLLNSSKFRAEVFNRSQGGTQIYINFGSVKTIQLNLPSKLEQQKIAAVLNNANKEIHLLEQQLADLKQEKKALMQQLLTGKRRVTV